MAINTSEHRAAAVRLAIKYRLKAETYFHEKENHELEMRRKILDTLMGGM